MTFTLNAAIDALIEVGAAHKHQYERIPYQLLQRLVWHGQRTESCIPCWGPGLLALFCGCANWGASETKEQLLPLDPAKACWAGRPPRSGKHAKDGTVSAPYGGLGIAHLDSGSLMDFMERWGFPWSRMPVPVTFAAAMAHKWREEWLCWSSGLLDKPEVQRWIVRYWLHHYWRESWECSEGDIGRAAVNVRIRNSAKSWAREWGHLGAGVQAAKYVARKRVQRGEHSADRAERQLRYVRRVKVIYDAVKIEAVD